MTFDGTVSLGSLIAAAAIVLSVVGTYGRLTHRIGVIETKVEALWEHFLGSKREVNRG